MGTCLLALSFDGHLLFIPGLPCRQCRTLPELLPSQHELSTSSAPAATNPPVAFLHYLGSADSMSPLRNSGFCTFRVKGKLLCCVQGRTREQLAAANAEAEACRNQVEVTHAKLQRLERSNAHLRKQRAQMMADLQVPVPLLSPCCTPACLTPASFTPAVPYLYPSLQNPTCTLPGPYLYPTRTLPVPYLYLTRTLACCTSCLLYPYISAAVPFVAFLTPAAGCAGASPL